MQSQNIVVAVPFEDKLLAPLHHWGMNFDFTHVDSIEFVHVVKQNITPLEFGLMESPDDSTFRDMKPSIEKFLMDESKKILPPDFKGKISYIVTKNYHPEEEVINLIKRDKGSLLVLATRGKHGFDGLFHSSFADYMIKFAPCDVYIVRPL